MRTTMMIAALAVGIATAATATPTTHHRRATSDTGLGRRPRVEREVAPAGVGRHERDADGRPDRDGDVRFGHGRAV